MALRSHKTNGSVPRFAKAPAGAVSLATLALLLAACGGTDDEVSFGGTGGTSGAGTGAGGRSGAGQGGSSASAGTGGSASKGGSGGTVSKGGSGGTVGKGGSAGATTNGGSAGEDGGDGGDGGTAGQGSAGKGGGTGGTGTAGKAGAGSGGKGGTAGKSGSAGTGGKGGADAGGAGGVSAGAGGSETAGAGGSETAGAGGSETAGAGGSETAGAGGSETAGAGGSETGGAGGANSGGAAGAPPTCGDGIRNQLAEQCDGKDFGNNTPSCPNGGSGTVTCNQNCTRNFSGCTPPNLCGNGNVDPGEECDSKSTRCQACKVVCNDQETRFEGRCYATTAPRSFGEAEAACVLRGGHLVTIGSAAENKLVYDLAGGNASLPLSSKIWIGLNDLQNEGTFRWVSGSNSTYRNFRSGEPNALTQTEDCSAMYLSLGTWNDDECAKAFVGVCEVNPQNP